MALAANGPAAPASASLSQPEANADLRKQDDAVSCNRQKPSEDLDPMGPVKRATSRRRFDRFFTDLAKRREEEMSLRRKQLLLTIGLFEKSEAVWPFCYNCNKLLRPTIESLSEHLQEDHPAMWRELEEQWTENEGAMRDWLSDCGPLGVVDQLFGLFYKGKSDDIWCKECDVRLKLKGCTTPRAFCESLEAHVEEHPRFAKQFKKEKKKMPQTEWRAEMLVKFFLEEHSQNKNLQDEIKLAERRVWLKQDGLFLVAQEFGADKGSLMLPHWNAELLIPHKQICTTLHWIAPKLGPSDDPRVPGRYALEALKDVAEGSWQKHGVGNGSSLAGLMSKAIFMTMTREHCDAYVRDGDVLRALCTTPMPEPDRSIPVPEDVVARRAEAKSFINRLSGVLPVGEAVRALEVEAVLIVNFGRYCDDPFQEALAENAIPIDSPLKTRLLKTICGSGSLLRHGLVIVEVGDDGKCSIKCVTTRPIIGAQKGSGRHEILLNLGENGEPKRTYMPHWTERDRVAFWMSKFLRPSALVLQVNPPTSRRRKGEIRLSAQGMTRTVDDGFFADARMVGSALSSGLRFFKKKVTTFPVAVEEVSNVLCHLRVTVEMLQKSHVGALIVLATSKSDFLNRLGTMSNKPEAMGAAVSAQLLLAIFDKSSELHDGAVVIDMYGDALGSSASIRWAGLLSDKTQGKKADSNASAKDGSRHRAADHLQSKTGFPVVVVSEQDGTLSVACRWTDVNGRIRNERTACVDAKQACAYLLGDLKRLLHLA